MAKSIPAKEFKAAVQAFNVVLKEADGENSIKVVAVKKDQVIEDFTNKVLDFIEKDKAAELPDIVIDFYNDYIVEENSTEAEEKAAKDAKKKSDKKKKEKKVKTGPSKIGRASCRERV